MKANRRMSEYIVVAWNVHVKRANAKEDANIATIAENALIVNFVKFGIAKWEMR